MVAVAAVDAPVVAAAAAAVLVAGAEGGAPQPAVPLAQHPSFVGFPVPIALPSGRCRLHHRSGLLVDGYVACRRAAWC